MKTYYIEIGIDGTRNFDNFIVLATEFSEALDKAGTYIEVQSRKKSCKGCILEIMQIELRDDIKDIKRISGVVIQPSFCK